MKLKQLIPTPSAWAHLRLCFLFFCSRCICLLLARHMLFIFGRQFWFFLSAFTGFPASNGYNSYFDRDEESTCLAGKTPE